jgi:SAM-dependent methyltransferase
LAQNIYDDAAFFAGYSQFPRSRDGLAAAGEWPALRAMLPPIAGLRVLDLGCGFGAFCRWAVEGGAAKVVGIDLSERMLETARQRSPGLPIRYQPADLDDFELPGEKFDLVFSSLAVHYVADFDALCARVRNLLVDGGKFVFSMEHPIYAARANPEWTLDSAGNRAFLVSNYLSEGERLTDWIATGVVKHHRLISTCINNLHGNGFRLDWIDEWGPSDAQLAAHPHWIDDSLRPLFLLIAAGADSPGPAHA